MAALIPQGLAASPNHYGFFNNLLILINCESLKEIGEMACVTPARSSRGQTLDFSFPLQLELSTPSDNH